MRIAEVVNYMQIAFFYIFFCLSGRAWLSPQPTAHGKDATSNICYTQVAAFRD